MNKGILKFSIISVLVCLFAVPTPTYAVIPPDFIFSIGSQIVQFFSIILLFLTTTFGIFIKFFKVQFSTIKHRKSVLFGVVLLIIAVSFTGTYLYDKNQQKLEYEKWLLESKKQNKSFKSVKQINTQKENNSKVKVLSQEKDVNIKDFVEENSFFEENKDKDIVISNKELDNIIKSNLDNYIILDAREDIEVENGYFPNSLHIRFADLKAGKWIELPKDKFVYVYCWSGIRGEETAKFLRKKEIAAFSFEDGANGWFKYGGKWIGNIKFGEKYTDKKYRIVFSTKEIKKYKSNGVFLVDARQPYKFKKSHIKDSVNIATMYIPSIDYEKAFKQVPFGSEVIVVCDDYVNCFDAKITGVELERHGYKFLGRYNKPWEYEK